MKNDDPSSYVRKLGVKNYVWSEWVSLPISALLLAGMSAGSGVWKLRELEQLFFFAVVARGFVNCARQWGIGKFPVSKLIFFGTPILRDWFARYIQWKYLCAHAIFFSSSRVPEVVNEVTVDCIWELLNFVGLQEVDFQERERLSICLVSNLSYQWMPVWSYLFDS